MLTRSVERRNNTIENKMFSSSENMWSMQENHIFNKSVRFVAGITSEKPYCRYKLRLAVASGVCAFVMTIFFYLHRTRCVVMGK